MSMEAQTATASPAPPSSSESQRPVVSRRAQHRSVSRASNVTDRLRIHSDDHAIHRRHRPLVRIYPNEHPIHHRLLTSTHELFVSEDGQRCYERQQTLLQPRLAAVPGPGRTP